MISFCGLQVLVISQFLDIWVTMLTFRRICRNITI